MTKIEWWWGLPGLQKPRLSPKSWVKEYAELVAFAKRAEELNYDAGGDPLRQEGALLGG